MAKLTDVRIDRGFAPAFTTVTAISLLLALGRMPSGDIRKMLRKALREIRGVLEPNGRDVREGDHS